MPECTTLVLKHEALRSWTERGRETVETVLCQKLQGLEIRVKLRSGKQGSIKTGVFYIQF